MLDEFVHSFWGTQMTRITRICADFFICLFCERKVAKTRSRKVLFENDILCAFAT